MVQMAARVNKPSTYNLIALNCFKMLFGRENARAELAVKGDDTYISGGFVERKIERLKKVTNHEPRTIEFLASQRDAFERTIAKLKEQVSRVIVVQVPITGELYSSLENAAEIDSYFSSFEGVDYYNFNDRMDLDSKAYFYDSHHLNQDGVILFNEELLNVLNL